MDLFVCLVLTILIFIFFLIIAYFGVCVEIFNALAIAFLASIISLNLYYPPGNLANQEATISLWLYVSYLILGFGYLTIYILSISLNNRKR